MTVSPATGRGGHDPGEPDRPETGPPDRTATGRSDDLGPVPAPGGTVVEVRVAAQADQVPIVRTVAAEVAARADFDLDSISDLRMAVDEVCATLVGLAAPGAALRCVFAVDPDRIQVAVTAPPRRPGAVFDTRGFGWRVLQTLVDEVVSRSGAIPASDGERHTELGIRFTKKALRG
jgi:serine/threonine-protein kinase RsbW